MLSLSELKAIMKANNIKGCTYYNKNELLTLLGERGLNNSRICWLKGEVVFVPNARTR